MAKMPLRMGLESIRIDQLTIGADPELFAYNPERNHYSSLIGKFPGSKHEPYQVNNDIAIQVDNVLAEFNISPCSTRDDFVRKISAGIDVCTDRIRALGLDVNIVPSAILPPEELTDPMCQEFGCEPDFNAWEGGTVNSRPNLEHIVETFGSDQYRGLRSAGGHIHIGHIANDLAHGYDVDPLFLTRTCDYFLGMWSIIHDRDTNRRMLYGTPGSFRFKSYGIEYRTLSNFWLKDPTLMATAFDLAVFSYRVAVQGPKWVNHDLAVQVITRGQVDHAYSSLKQWEGYHGFPPVSEYVKKYNRNYVIEPNTGEITPLHFDQEGCAWKAGNGVWEPLRTLSFRNLVFDNLVFLNHGPSRQALVQYKLAPRSSPKGITTESYAYMEFRKFQEKIYEGFNVNFNEIVVADFYKYPSRISNTYLNLWSSFAIAPQLVFQQGDQVMRPDARFCRVLFYLGTKIGEYNFLKGTWKEQHPLLKHCPSIHRALSEVGIPTT